MLLKEICTPDVVFCDRRTSVLEAARIMRKKHIGDLVVVDDPEDACLPVGLVTDRDIVIKVLGEERSASTVTVGEIMCAPIVVASHNEEVSQGIARMRAHGVRRLPITGPLGKLTGVVTLDDLLKELAKTTNALLDIVTQEQDHERRTCR